MEKKGYLDMIVEWITSLLKMWFGDQPPAKAPTDPAPSPQPTPLPGPTPDPDKPVVAYPVDPENPYEHLELALRITGNFEGSGFDQVTGDFDGQGISAGILQWNYGQGSLQKKILRPWIDRFGPIDNYVEFPLSTVNSTANMDPKQALAYVRRYMLKGTKVKPDWLSAWKRFMLTDACIELQIEAAHDVAEQAHKVMIDWQLSSARAFCFFFDIVTQNGSMSSVVKTSPNRATCLKLVEKASSLNKNIWKPLIETATEEQLTLFHAAYLRASLSRPAYFQDVFARKGTIALGRGYVHGESWDLKFPEP